MIQLSRRALLAGAGATTFGQLLPGTSRADALPPYEGQVASGSRTMDFYTYKTVNRACSCSPLVMRDNPPWVKIVVQNWYGFGAWDAGSLRNWSAGFHFSTGAGTYETLPATWNNGQP